jgi:hypothetical protein
VASPEETRVKNLESELGLLKNQVQQTLLDIREHVLEFTNPFTAEARLVRAWQERTAQAAEANLGGEADLESLLDEDDDIEDEVMDQAQPAAAAAPPPAPVADAFEEQPEAAFDGGDEVAEDFGADLGSDPEPAAYEPEQYNEYAEIGGYDTAAPQDGGWDDAFEQPAHEAAPAYEEQPYGDQGGYDAAPDQGGYDQGYDDYGADDQYANADADAYEEDYAEPVVDEYFEDESASPAAAGAAPSASEPEAEEDEEYHEPTTEAPPEIGEEAVVESTTPTPVAAPMQPIAEMISGERGMDLVKMISLVRWVDQNMDRIGKDRVMVILDIHAMSGRITEETRDIVKRLCALDRDDATRVPVKDVVAAILTIDNVLDDRQTQSQRLLGMLFDDPFGGGLPQGGAGLLG